MPAPELLATDGRRARFRVMLDDGTPDEFDVDLDAAPSARAYLPPDGGYMRSATPYTAPGGEREAPRVTQHVIAPEDPALVEAARAAGRLPSEGRADMSFTLEETGQGPPQPPPPPGVLRQMTEAPIVAPRPPMSAAEMAYRQAARGADMDFSREPPMRPVFGDDAQPQPRTLDELMAMPPEQRAAFRAQPVDMSTQPAFFGGPAAQQQAPAAAPADDGGFPFVYGGAPDYSRPMPAPSSGGAPAQPAAGGAQPFDMTGGAAGPRQAPQRRAGGARRPGAPGAPPDFVGALTQAPGDVYRALYGQDYASEGPLATQQRLAAQQGNLNQRAAELQGRAMAEAADAEREAEERRVELEQDRRGAMADARGRYDRALQRVNSMQVDPSRFFSDGGTAVGAALAVALGAVGSAISGNDSYRQDAIGLIQEAINRDISAQRDNISNARAGLDGEASLLAMTRAEFEDRGAAEEAAKAALLQATARRVGMMEADLTNASARQEAEALRFQLEQEAGAAQAAALRAEEDRALQQRMLMARIRQREADAARAERRAMGGAGGARPPAPLTSARMDDFNRLVNSSMTPEQAATALRIDPSMVPREGVFSAATNSDQSGLVSTLSTQLDRLEALIPQGDADIPGVGTFASRLPDAVISEEGRALRQQLDAVVESVGRLHSGGAISDTEFVLFSRILGAAPGQSDDALRRGIATIRAEINARMNRAPQGRGTDERTRAAVGAAGGRVRD